LRSREGLKAREIALQTNNGSIATRVKDIQTVIYAAYLWHWLDKVTKMLIVSGMARSQRGHLRTN